MYDGYSSTPTPRAWPLLQAQDAFYPPGLRALRPRFTVVQADSGAIGGSASEEFMVLADTGEDAVVRCEACEYGANLEKAETGPRPAPWKDETETPLVEVATPGKGGIADVVDFLGITASRMIKCLVYESEQGFVVPSCAATSTSTGGSQERVGVEHVALAARTGGEGDRAPAATSVRTSFDGKRPRDRREVDPDAVNAGGRGRRTGTSRLRAAPGRERPRVGGIRAARAGDPPALRKRSPPARIEVGHIFKSAPNTRSFGCTFTDEKGETKPVHMGATGSASGGRWRRPSSSHTRRRDVWPLALAPQVALVSLNASDESTRREPTRCMSRLQADGSRSSTTTATSGPE